MLSVDNARDDAAAMGVDATNIGAGSAVSGTNAGPGYGVRGSSSVGSGVLGLHSNASGARAGVQGQTRSTNANAAGVRGLVTATAPGSLSAGVRGEISDDASSSGAGVYGQHAGNGYGLYGVSEGPFGYGLFAQGGSYGAFLQASAATAGTTGVYTSGNTRGVDAFAEATAGTSYGVFADADASDGGTGVHGRADAGTGVNFGVRGEVSSPTGYAGHFESNATGNNGTGVIGLSSDAVAASVPGAYYAGGGEFVGGNGVIGVSDRTSGYGVVGLQGAGQYAGYFVGNTHVSGTLSKSAGSFRIDHPRDPENKTLSHPFVESPDMKNIYDGEVTLGDDGAVTVKLPPYFGALNRDFRYQLDRDRRRGAQPAHLAGGQQQPVRDRRRPGGAEGVLAGHRDPQGCVREREPDQGRRAQAGGRARQVPQPTGIRRAREDGDRRADQRQRPRGRAPGEEGGPGTEDAVAGPATGLTPRGVGPDSSGPLRPG